MPLNSPDILERFDYEYRIFIDLLDVPRNDSKNY